MASTDGRPIPIKGSAYRVTFPIFDSTGALVTGAAGLDSEVSKDAGIFADCTNEATEIATSSGMYYLDLTSTEMNADTVSVIVKTSTANAKTTPIVIYPKESGDISVSIETGGIVAASFAAGAIDATAIADNAIDAGSIATGAITSAKIAAGAITSSAFAAGAITSSVFAAGAINAAAIADGAIDAATFAAGAIDAAAIASDAITAAKIADGAIDAGSIATGAITAAKFAAGAIDAAAIADNAIDAGSIATGAITSAKFAAGAINAAAIADGAIDAATFAAGAIDAAAIADNAIDAAAIASSAITAAKFGTGAIDATAFAQDAADKVWSTTVRTVTGFAAAAIQSIWDNLLSATYAVGSIGARFKTWLATLGADDKVTITTDDQDLSAKLHVDAKAIFASTTGAENIKKVFTNAGGGASGVSIAIRSIMLNSGNTGLTPIEISNGGSGPAINFNNADGSVATIFAFNATAGGRALDIQNTGDTVAPVRVKSNGGVGTKGIEIPEITSIMGSGFGTGDSLKEISDAVSSIDPATPNEFLAELFTSTVDVKFPNGVTKTLEFGQCISMIASVLSPRAKVEIPE